VTQGQEHIAGMRIGPFNNLRAKKKSAKDGQGQTECDQVRRAYGQIGMWHARVSVKEKVSKGQGQR